MGYEGEILPVNPRGGTFSGLPVYRTVEEIPGVVDFAVIAVAAKAVPAVLDACRKKGAAGAEVMSSGFSETGTPEGKALEEEIREIAARGIRVIGPNCFGIYCPKSGLTYLPNPDLSRESGPVAFLSQSGGMASDFANMGKWMGLRFSKTVSYGNGADLREAELLRYFGEDGETGVIALYIEGVGDGDAFFRELRATARKKPVVVLKGGLSEAGGRSVASHTASMGGSGRIWRSVLRQAGTVQVEDTTEMAEACLAFSLLPKRAVRGISVAGGGGALGIAACDAAESFGIGIPPLGDASKKEILALLPRSGSSAANPIDVANPYTPPETLKRIFGIAARQEGIDLQIMVFLLHHFKHIAQAGGKAIEDVIPYPAFAESMAEVVKETGKPVCIVLPNTKKGLGDLDIVEIHARARQAFLERGLPVFDEIRNAVRAVGHVNRYYGREGGNP
jgi:acyl-CoA synthetase (NDP forming)